VTATELIFMDHNGMILQFAVIHFILFSPSSYLALDLFMQTYHYPLMI